MKQTNICRLSSDIKRVCCGITLNANRAVRCVSGVGTKSTLRGGEARPETVARMAEPGVWLFGEMPPPHRLGGLGSAVSSPSGIRGKAPAAKSFGAFWVLQVSSPLVLQCKTV